MINGLHIPYRLRPRLARIQARREAADHTYYGALIDQALATHRAKQAGDNPPCHYCESGMYEVPPTGCPACGDIAHNGYPSLPSAAAP